MSEDDVLEPAMGELRKQLCGLVVGKVAEAAPYPLLQVPGVVAVKEYVVIVVEFDHKRV
jgi:hypothetical protein